MISLSLQNDSDLLSLDSLLHSPAGWQALSGATGLGLPPRAVQWLEGAGDGAIYRGHRELPRDVDLPLLGEDAGRAGLGEQFSRLARMLAGPCRLVAKDSVSGESWYLNVIRTGGGSYVYGVDTVGESDVNTVITLRAGDPIWTAVEPQLIEAASGDGGETFLPLLSGLHLAPSGLQSGIEVNVQGDAPALPTWEVHGPLSSIKATSPAGEVFHWEGDLPVGSILFIDTRTGAVTDDTGANRYDGMQGSPKLWRLPSGRHTLDLELGGVGPASMLRLYWHPRKWALI